MIRPFAACVLALGALLALVGCGDGRQGIVIRSDGSVADNSPENALDRAQELIAKDLRPRVATVAIAQLPRWQTESRARAEGWYWDMMHVEVTVPGQISDRERGEIVETARRRVRGAVTGGADALLITVTGSTAAPPPAAAPAPAADVPAAPSMPASATAPAGERRYTIQPGDTLGDISAVFFGDAQHWRDIVAANPGLDPAHLTVGAELKIPPKP